MNRTPKTARKNSSKLVARYKQETVLMEIEKAIGKACPSTKEIALATGLSESDISRATSALYTRKILSSKSNGKERVITIVATGESTLPGIFFNKRGYRSYGEGWERPTGISMDGVRYDDATNIPPEDGAPIPLNHPLRALMPRIRTQEVVNQKLKFNAENVWA